MAINFKTAAVAATAATAETTTTTTTDTDGIWCNFYITLCESNKKRLLWDLSGRADTDYMPNSDASSQKNSEKAEAYAFAKLVYSLWQEQNENAELLPGEYITLYSNECPFFKVELELYYKVTGHRRHLRGTTEAPAASAWAQRAAAFLKKSGAFSLS